MSSNGSHSHVKMIFLTVFRSGPLLFSHYICQIHMAACIPLMFSLRSTDILTAVQKYSVSPMFVCLAYSLL